MPLWATLFERFAGARDHAARVVGLALGLRGVAIFNLGGEMRATGAGALCALVAPMGWALGSIGRASACACRADRCDGYADAVPEARR